MGWPRRPGAPLPRLLEIIRSPRGEAFVLAKNGYVRPALLGTTAHPDHLDLAARAHVRHQPTPYDQLPVEGVDRSDARAAVREAVEEVVARWRGAP